MEQKFILSLRKSRFQLAVFNICSILNSIYDFKNSSLPPLMTVLTIVESGLTIFSALPNSVDNCPPLEVLGAAAPLQLFGHLTRTSGLGLVLKWWRLAFGGAAHANALDVDAAHPCSDR